MGMVIKQAEKVRQHARVCFWGVEKSGKTHAALELATALVGPGGKIGVISSERGSSSLLARKFPHDLIDLTVDEGNNAIRNPFSSKRYEEALRLFAGYDAIVVDSLSHLWEGEGGILEVVRAKGGEFQNGWDAGSPLYQRFLNLLLGVPCHLIVTLRAKDAYTMEEYTNQKGEKKIGPKNVGQAPVIRKYFGYEMQLMVRMDGKVGLVVSSACEYELPKDTEIESVSEDLAPSLSLWLEGAPPPEKIPTLSEVFKSGVQSGAWVPGTFYAIAGRLLGQEVTKTSALTAEQAQILMDAVQRGSVEQAS